MPTKITETLLSSLNPADKAYEIFDTEITGFLLRVEPSGVMTYYFAYKPRSGKYAGRRRRYKIGRSGPGLKVRQARDAAETCNAAVVHGEDPQEVKNQTERDAELAKYQTLKGFIDLKYGPYIKSHRKQGQQTLDRLKHNFDDLMSKSLFDITHWDLEKWRSEAKKGGKAVSTINRDVGDLKAVLTKAVEWELVPVHPLAKLKPLKTDTRSKVRYLTEDESERLRRALKERDERIKRERASGNAWRRERGYPELPDLYQYSYGDHLTPMVLLTLNTGLRRGEMFSLRWEDVNFPKKTITVVGQFAKTGDTRHIPLNEEALGALEAWRNQVKGDELVFPSQNGRRLISIRKIWGNLLKDAKIHDFRWHDLRHSFASNLVMKGVPLNTVRELLGHEDITTTLRYAHLAPDHKADAVAKL